MNPKQANRIPEGAIYQNSRIVERIKGTMAARRLTMRAVSDATKIPYRTLQNHLRGRSAIPAASLGKIAQALDVSTDWLILGRPADLDLGSLAIAIASLDHVRAAANKTSQEMSLVTLARLLADFYIDDYIRHRAPTPRDDEAS